MLLPVASRPNLVVVGIVITLVLFYTSFRTPYHDEQDATILSSSTDSHKSGPAAKPGHAHSNIHHVRNETLGFQEVYMISLPERSDKQDAFAMQAAFSEISYTQMHGVYGFDIPVKALPHTMGQEANVIGCWRAHMNVYQKMVHEKVSTALIFEDDADWDVALKYQLVQFAQGSRFILNSTEHAPPHSPYGDDWDILFLGHCGTWVLPADNRRFFVIPDDPTVEVPAIRADNVDQPKMTPWEKGPDNGNRTRIVFHAEGAVCTAAYAISQRGARKALYHMSMTPYNSPVDWGLINLCKNAEYDFTCIASFPQLIGVSRPTANTAKWSDIGYGSDADRTVEEGHSLHLVYPVRQNIPNFLEGKTIFESKHPEFAPPRSIPEIGSAIGHIEILEPEEVPQLGDT
jgi:GR25 family glycosyltransferase involved in LPS biosynthesis